MNDQRQPSGPIRFGAFEVDVAARELRKSGVRIRVQEQPFRVLAMLLARPGEVVTREELQQELWPGEEYGEFDLGLNTAVKKLRHALGDSAAHPRFIETIPRVGYRFAGSIEGGYARSARVRRGRGRMVAALLVCAAAVGAAFVVTEPRSIDPELLVETVLTSQLGSEIRPSFSPDGSQVAFSGRPEGQDYRRIYVQVLGSSRALPVTEAESNDLGPAWSPDGRSIAFIRRKTRESTGAIMIVSALGGAPRRLLEVDCRDQWAVKVAWSPDGSHVAFGGRPGPGQPFQIGIASIETSELTWLTSPAADVFGDAMPAFAPDGSKLAFVRQQGYTSGWNVYVLALSRDLQPTGAPRRITDLDRIATAPEWTPDGREVVFIGEQGAGYEGIWSVAEAGAAEPRLLWRRPGVLLRDFGYASLAVGSDAAGRTQIAFAFEDRQDVDVYRTDLSGPRRGEPVPVIATSTRDTQARYSPDGRKIAFFSGDPMRDLWVADADGRNRKKLTDLESRVVGPVYWSPDGSRIAFHSRHAGAADLYTVDVEGARLRRLTDNAADDVIPTYSRDGDWIYFLSNRGGDYALWKMPSDGGPATLLRDVRAPGGEESWDGKSFYYSLRRTGDIYSLSREDPAAPPRLLVAGANSEINPFQTAPSSIYFVRRLTSQESSLDPASAPGVLCRYDVREGTTEELFPIKGYLSSVARDESSVLTVYGADPGVDLRMLEEKGR